MSFLRSLACLAVFLAPLCAQAEEPGLPLIEETCDEICIIQTPGSDHCRVVFFRGDSVLATRLVVDEMIWGTRDGLFYVEWQDYWTAERIVYAPVFSLRFMEVDPTQEGQNGPWWCMMRNMRNLREP